jgi:hypothetical protein
MRPGGGENTADSLPGGAVNRLKRRSAFIVRSPRERGSALMFVLFACLMMAVVVQALSVVILCAERAMGDERTGRTRLSEKDATLAALRQRLLVDWQPVPATWWPSPEVGGATTEGMAVDVVESDGWLMRASVRQEPAYSVSTVSAAVERGRDGLDLPLAAMVAGTMTASTGREAPWVDSEWAGEPQDTEPLASVAPCYLSNPPADPLLGPGCVIESLDTPWRLDPGWLEMLDAAADTRAAEEGSGEGTSESSHVAIGDDVICLGGGMARTIALPPECGLGAPDAPILVVATGGADLDARNRGDLYGVIVVDDGSVLLEGTILHGAVFATGEVALGEVGQMLFSSQILRWATDRSLRRVRLVPGTRWEALE